MKTKIVIAEDQPRARAITLQKIADFEELECIADFQNGQDIVHFFQKGGEADLILMDIQMPQMGGIEATRQIKNINSKVKILFLTVFDHDQKVFEGILSGADGYLLKDTSSEKLFESIKQTMEGGASMTPSIAAKALSFLRGQTPAKAAIKDEVQLTKREKEVLQQLAKGNTYKETATALFISEGTVRKHIENTYRKLYVNNKIQAIEEGKRRNII